MIDPKKIKASNKELAIQYYEAIGLNAGGWNDYDKTVRDYNNSAIATIGALVRNNADLTEFRDHGFAELVEKYIPTTERRYEEMLSDAKKIDELSGLENIDGFGTSGKALYEKLMQRVDEAAKETTQLLREYSVHSTMVETLQKMPIEQVIAVYNQKAIETPVKDKVMEMDENEKAAFLEKLKKDNLIFSEKNEENSEGVSKDNDKHEGNKKQEANDRDDER